MDFHEFEGFTSLQYLCCRVKQTNGVSWTMGILKHRRNIFFNILFRSGKTEDGIEVMQCSEDLQALSNNNNDIFLNTKKF